MSFFEIINLSSAELSASCKNTSARPMFIFMIGSTELSLLKDDD